MKETHRYTNKLVSNETLTLSLVREVPATTVCSSGLNAQSPLTIGNTRTKQETLQTANTHRENIWQIFDQFYRLNKLSYVPEFQCVVTCCDKEEKKFRHKWELFVVPKIRPLYCQ